ncbi:MAG TPA: hypothetical protein VGF23_18860 [Gaiellaceae bacterium]
MSDPIRWSRLEPIARDKSLETGLEARVHDPLWLLARQRQLGELTADADLGSAVVADVSVQVAPLSAYRAGPPNGAAPAPYDPNAAPLEAVVEAESVRALPTARLRAQAGLHFLRLLAANGMGRYADAYRRQYALAAEDVPDADSRRFLAVVAGRAPDGTRLYADLAPALRPKGRKAAALPADPPVDAGDAADVLRAAEAWLAWFDALFLEPGAGGDAWVDERLEYAFGVAAPDANGGVALEADELTDGRLDWHAFSAAVAAQAPGGEASAVGPLTLVPSPVTYPGMPAQRFWEFEDAVVDFGGVEAQPEDLGRMLLTEFALVFGGDWLMVPVEAPLGSLVRIVSLDVRDTFGRVLRVGPTAALEGSLGGWRMFTLSGDADNGLLLPPVLAAKLQGTDLEEVLLLRDETANLAWAVERRIEGQNGAPVDRAQVGAETNGDATVARPEPANTFAYRLATSVPEHWLPLLPERTQLQDPSIGLRLGALERTLPDGTTEPIKPLGQLLQPLAGEIVLREEEVPREGARLSRAYQLARWVDGSTFLWLARRKGVGRGEGSSGLRYDSVETPR